MAAAIVKVSDSFDTWQPVIRSPSRSPSNIKRLSEGQTLARALLLPWAATAG